MPATKPKRPGGRPGRGKTRVISLWMLEQDVTRLDAYAGREGLTRPQAVAKLLDQVGRGK